MEAEKRIFFIRNLLIIDPTEPFKVMKWFNMRVDKINVGFWSPHKHLNDCDEDEEEEDIKVEGEDAIDKQCHISKKDSLKKVQVEDRNEFIFRRFDVNCPFWLFSHKKFLS